MDREEKTYGGCEGPDAMYVKCISSDGHEFIVKREHALTSGMIKAMLSGLGQFAENETNEVNFREIPSRVLSKVCMYFTYKVLCTDSTTEIPEFPISPEIALELLMAVNKINYNKLLTFQKVHMCILQMTSIGTSATLAAMAVSTVIQGSIYNSKVDYSNYQVGRSLEPDTSFDGTGKLCGRVNTL
ncbi:elongin-C-like [Aotus nancymaae]|uniref:elongin-C-like n=1 Tax=Aotus nancymaae TaxID=37293 RepID=UPI0030FEC452